jgi:hypothetical protein
VGIELKAMLKARKLLIPLNAKYAKKHRIRLSEVHGGYTESLPHSPILPPPLISSL